MTDNAIDYEARRLAKEALETAETAMLQSESAVRIAREANGRYDGLESTVTAGFKALGMQFADVAGKIDAAIMDTRRVEAKVRDGGSIRPRIDTLSEADEAIRQELANVRAELDKRTASLEAERGSRERADAARVKAEEDRRKAVRRVAWAIVLGAATTLGGVLVTGAVYEARRVAEQHAAPAVHQVAP